ncbi:MAG: RNA 2',3'-cyclic phosphodiesterase [Candidatus Nezhaarchaeota archaeon]|nr:RNA 2',3'-cyclic phosphodiesterase [Candidatus Nezhaarchaeota archaeon]
MRCFIAVDIDQPELRTKLQKLQRELGSLRCDLKLVEPENIHVTLRFLGEVPRSLVEEVTEALGRLKAEPFHLLLKGLGAFPSLSRPRVVWVGVSEGMDKLSELHHRVEELLRPLGFKPEREAFTPHITLARVKGARGLRDLVDFISKHREDEVGLMMVEEVKLKRSVLTPSGPIYSDIFTKKLSSE